MHTRRHALATVLFFLIAAQYELAAAGYVVVMADTTPLFSLLGNYEGGEGNREFFRNLAGERRSVLVIGDGINVDAFEFYQRRELMAAYWTTTQLSEAMLEDVSLVISTNNEKGFTSAESQLLTSFVNRGGNLFLGVEPPPSKNAEQVRTSMHALLRSMNVGIEIINPIFDVGTNIAKGDRISPHPLTNGVTAFSYGWASQVRGGEPLFISTVGYPFATAVFVPEPDPATAIGWGFAATVAMRRKK